MSLLAEVKVRVPATTSNLGPGFDCLGMALGLYNELTLELHSEKGPPVIEISGEGEKTLPKDRTNLIVRAASSVLDDRLEGRLVFKALNRIPLARGLGSSAAAAVAGIVAANRLLKPSPLEPEQLLQYAVLLEGHPDNAAPALQGGLVVSVKERKAFKTYALKPHKELCAVVCIPAFELSTAKARAVLPQTVLRDQAVANISRALLLSSALERGQWERLSAAMEDELHQPYRASLIPGFAQVLASAREAAPCGAALSGAGPTILALCREGPDAKKIGSAMEKTFAEHGVKSRALALPVDAKGAQASA